MWHIPYSSLIHIQCLIFSGLYNASRNGHLDNGMQLNVGIWRYGVHCRNTNTKMDGRHKHGWCCAWLGCPLSCISSAFRVQSSDVLTQCVPPLCCSEAWRWAHAAGAGTGRTCRLSPLTSHVVELVRERTARAGVIGGAQESGPAHQPAQSILLHCRHGLKATPYIFTINLFSAASTNYQFIF